jgi:hypothetical protein
MAIAMERPEDNQTKKSRSLCTQKRKGILGHSPRQNFRVGTFSGGTSESRSKTYTIAITADPRSTQQSTSDVSGSVMQAWKLRFSIVASLDDVQTRAGTKQ